MAYIRKSEGTATYCQSQKIHSATVISPIWKSPANDVQLIPIQIMSSEFTIGSGIEFELELPSAPDSFGLSVDISDSSTTIANVEDNIFGLGANELLTLTFVGDILGISNLFVSGVSVISDAFFSFIGDSLSIDLDSDAFYQVGSFISFDISVATIPEPATLALFGIDLAGMGLARRRRTR